MILRKAIMSDVSKLFALEEKIFTPQNFPLSRASFAYHVKNNLLYVAEVDDHIVGYILALIKRAHAKIYSLGVNKEYRGQRIAPKLFDTILHELLSMGFAKILLEVRTDNTHAIALYRSFGFGVKKILKSFYLDGCDGYLMEFEKNLSC